MLQTTCRGLLYRYEKLKLSALALSLQGDLTTVESVLCTQEPKVSSPMSLTGHTPQ